jgi:transposase
MGNRWFDCNLCTASVVHVAGLSTKIHLVVAIIPSNGSRAQRLPLDEELYKARTEIECTFSLLKQARRFATRYEKTLRNYAAVVAVGCAQLWLRL